MLSEDELRELREIEQRLREQDRSVCRDTPADRQRPRRERVIHDVVAVTALGEAVVCDALGAFEGGLAAAAFAVAVLLLRWRRFPPGAARRHRPQLVDPTDRPG